MLMVLVNLIFGSQKDCKTSVNINIFIGRIVIIYLDSREYNSLIRLVPCQRIFNLEISFMEGRRLQNTYCNT